MSKSKKQLVGAIVCSVLGIMAIVWGVTLVANYFYFGLAVILLASGLTVASISTTGALILEVKHEYFLPKPQTKVSRDI